MRDTVVDQARRGLHDAPVDSDVASGIGRAPALLLIADLHPRRMQVEFLGPGRIENASLGALAIPGD